MHMEYNQIRQIRQLGLLSQCDNSDEPFNAENHISSTPLVFDLEFEGHAVGMWRRNLAPEN